MERTHVIALLIALLVVAGLTWWYIRHHDKKQAELSGLASAAEVVRQMRLAGEANGTVIRGAGLAPNVQGTNFSQVSIPTPPPPLSTIGACDKTRFLPLSQAAAAAAAQRCASATPNTVSLVTAGAVAVPTSHCTNAVPKQF
jgi:type II secretory pathway pseudopilin PulG